MNKFELRWVGTDPLTRVLQYRVELVQMEGGSGKIHTTWTQWQTVPTADEQMKGT